MEISSIPAVSEDTGVVVHLRDVTRQPMYFGEGEARRPLTITVVGTYSARYREAMRRVKERNFAVQRAGEDLELSQLEANQFEIEAACITAWDFTSGGAPLPITTDAWRALVAKQPQWQEQVQAAMNQHERFFTGS